MGVAQFGLVFSYVGSRRNNNIQIVDIYQQFIVNTENFGQHTNIQLVKFKIKYNQHYRSLYHGNFTNYLSVARRPFVLPLSRTAIKVKFKTI